MARIKWIGISAAFLGLLISAQFAFGQAKTSTPAPASPADQLRSSDPKVREKAAKELGETGGPDAVAALTGALKDPVVNVRRQVVVSLASIHDPAAVDALCQATHDTDNPIRILAIRGLVGHYTGSTPALGFTGFMEKSWNFAKGKFQVDTTRIDPGVIVDPKVVSTLEAALADTTSIDVQREAAKGLGILVAQDAVPSLVKMAHSTDPDLDRECLNSLSKIKDISAGPSLVDLLDSPDRDVKRDAAVTLGILRTHEAVPKLQLMYQKSSDKKTREKALEGLGDIGDPVSVPIFLQALWSSDKAQRISAAEGLARAKDPKTLSEVQKAIAREKDSSVRLAEEFAVTALGQDDYFNDMITQLGSKMRGDTAQAYLAELARNPKYLQKLYPYLSNHDASIREQLAIVLMYSGDSTSIAPLEQLSRDSNGDVAAQALRALAAIRARTGAARTS